MHISKKRASKHPYFCIKSIYMICLGIIGEGIELEKHIKTLQKIPQYKIVGFYCQHKEIGIQTSINCKVKLYDTPHELLNEIDALDIVGTNELNYFIANHAVKKSKHIFISSPNTYSPEELRYLIKLSNESNVRLQIEKINRFNASLIKAKTYIKSPKLIEIYRNVTFKLNHNQRQEYAKYLIQDIDLIIEIINLPFKKIQTTGIYNRDKFANNMINARIEFPNGLIASITNNFIADNNLVEAAYYQEDGSVHINFTKNRITLKKLENNLFSTNTIYVKQTDTLREDLISFAQSIKNRTNYSICNENEILSLLVSEKIMNKIEKIKEGV